LHRCFAGKKLGDLVVVEGEPGGAEAERVGGKADAPDARARLELGGAVTALAEPDQRPRKVAQEEEGCGAAFRRQRP
jgi:hypothetical protein